MSEIVKRKINSEGTSKRRKIYKAKGFVRSSQVDTQCHIMGQVIL